MLTNLEPEAIGIAQFRFFFFFGYEFGSWRFYSYTCGYEDTEYLDNVV
jgi:hypothetical protein